MNEGSFVVMCNMWLKVLVDDDDDDDDDSDDHDHDSDTQESTGLLWWIRANTILINQMTNQLYGILC
jgi:hypothetical protein